MKGAGKLDRRVTIERVVDGQLNGFGEPGETWSNYVTVWASRQDVSDGEKAGAGQRDSALVSRFVIRSNSQTKTITTVDRLVYDGFTWNILGAKETAHGRNRYIELTASRDSD